MKSDGIRESLARSGSLPGFRDLLGSLPALKAIVGELILIRRSKLRRVPEPNFARPIPATQRGNRRSVFLRQ
jgi:hypothetical protein